MNQPSSSNPFLRPLVDFSDESFMASLVNHEELNRSSLRSYYLVGRYFLGLLCPAHWEWVHRRVEEVQFLRVEGDTRRVSLDVNVQRLRELASSIPGVKPDRLPVPLAWMQKTLMFDFSVIGPKGRPTSLWTSGENRVVAFSFLLAYIVDNELLGSNKIGSARWPSSDLLDYLWFISDSLPSANPARWLADVAIAKNSLPEQAAGEWALLRTNKQFIYWVNQFFVNYVPVILVDTTVDTLCIVKWEVNSAPFDPRGKLTWKTRFGIDPWAYRIVMESCMEARSEHLKVVTAPDLQISSRPTAYVGQAPYGLAFRRDGSHCRVARDGMTVYRSHRMNDTTQEDDYGLEFNVRPRLEGFLGPTLFGLGSAFVALLLPLVASLCFTKDFDHALSSGGTSGAWLSLALAAASSMSAVFVTRDKDYGRKMILGWLQRLVFSASALASLVLLYTAILGPYLNIHFLMSLWSLALMLVLAALGFLGMCWRQTTLAICDIEGTQNLVVPLYWRTELSTVTPASQPKG